MNCTICGQAALPGAMLCKPCRAALKRARYVSVQEVPPVSIIGGGRPRRRNPKPATLAPGATAAAAPGVPPARRLALVRHPVALGGVAIAAMAVVAYLGQQRGPQPVPAASPASTGLVWPASASGSAVIPVSASPARPAPADPPAKASPVAAAASRAAAPSADAGAAAEAAAARTSAAPTARTVAPAAREVTLDSFGPGPAMVRTAAPQAPRIAPPAVRAPSPPDRWASMRDSLAACDREGGLSGFLCDQRVRMEGCEGYWGRVPDCPGPPENPGGQ